jgi:large subunit ribosomal protein L22
MEVMARSKYIRRAPRKARLVADSVRGLRVIDALAQAIRSAAANAEHNHSLTREDLWLKQILVDEGPMMKRIHQVSRGMAHQYFHRTCHITAVVEDRPEARPERLANRQARRRVAASKPAQEPVASGEPAEGES